MMLVERGLLAAAAGFATLAIAGWCASAPRSATTPRTSIGDVADVGVAAPESIDAAARVVAATDPFRLDRHPASVAYRSDLEGVAPPPKPPKPQLVLEGLVGGTALIDGARKSIRLIDKKLSDPHLAALLNARRNEGLTVEVFGSKWIGSLKSHGMLMLLDDRLVVVGGLALAAISLDSRREVALIVDEPMAVSPIVELFRTIDAVPTKGALRATDGTGLSL